MPDSFVTPWTVACQAPLSMGFPRQESWSGLRFLLQGIFQTQGLNWCLLHWQVGSTMEPLRKPVPKTNWLIYSRNLFLVVLEPGKSKTKVLAWLGQGRCHFFVSSHSKRGEGPIWTLFYKGTNTIHEGSTLRT